MMRTRTTAAAMAAVALLTLAACGDSDDSGDDTAGTTSSADSTDLPVCTADDVEVSGDFGDKPTVTIPDDCSPPTELLIKDLSVGGGPVAKSGATVVADYLLTTWSDGQVADNSFDRGQPFPVENLGQASVIAGWNQGLVGMNEGTRRLLIVPPDLGYGSTGQGSIGPDETLVFVIDAVQVTNY